MLLEARELQGTKAASSEGGKTQQIVTRPAGTF